jgi:ATP-dependent Clp protease ATP-binding subunit ClpA
MFERFTQRTILTIMLAQEESRRLGHNFVGAEQLLLGLIATKYGAASTALASCGVSLGAARTEVEKLTGRGDGKLTEGIPFSSQAKRMLESAWEEAKLLEHNYIGTEHLLMGLIREGDTIIASKVLKSLNVELPNLRSQLEYAMLEAAEPFEEPLLKRLFDRLFGIRKEFSTTTIKVLNLAENLGKTSSHRCLGSEQILLAILQGPENKAGTILREVGVTVDKVNDHMKPAACSFPGDPATKVIYTPRALRIIAEAYAEAHESKQVPMPADYLLLAILEQSSGLAKRVLDDFNVDSAKLRTELLKRLANK